jgi:hypothetical protein
VIRCLYRFRNRRLDRYTARMRYGLHRPAQRDLVVVCRCVEAIIRSHKRLAKLMPDLFNYAATEREYREQAARAAWDLECQAILRRVYGSELHDLTDIDRS